MDLGIRADCSLKTSAQFTAVIKIGNEIHWASLGRILKIKWKTQPTESHSPVTGPRTKGVFQKVAKQVSAFLQFKTLVTVQETVMREHLKK